MDQGPETLVIGTAGHIDHGKSALVTALTGTNPDRLKEEQARGITIDLGFAHLSSGGTTIAFVDVPGHERFVKNMLAGVGGIDAVLFVVAADESIKPQTREHFDICRLLGIQHGLIALTKVDVVDDDTRELVELEVREFVAGSFLANAPILPVSARTGAGLDRLRAALADLVGVRPRQARADVIRLPVDRVFSVKGFGTVVTGTLVSGRVAEATEVVLLPAGEPVRVRGVEVHGRQTSEAVAPNRVAVNLGAVEAGAIRRGVTLASPDSLAVTRRADVRLALVPSARPLEHGTRVRVHQGTHEVLGRVSVSAIREPGSGEWIPAQSGESGVVVPPGGEAYLRLRLERPAVLTRGDRVVIRSYSPPTTIAGGVVLDPEPPAGGVRRKGALDRFRRTDDPDGVVDVWLAEKAGLGLGPADLVRRGGLGPADAARALEAMIASGVARAAGGRVFDAAFVGRLAAAVERIVSGFHERQPIETGMPRDAVRQQAAEGVRTELFDLVVGDLIARARLAGTDRLRLASHQPAGAGAMASAVEAVLAELGEEGLRPPDEADLAAAAGVAPATLKPLLQVLVREGRVVRLDALCFHPDALARLKAEVRSQARGSQGNVELDMAAFKARHGLSRKYAIPLLEWLDRERVTRREGNRRVILAD